MTHFHYTTASRLDDWLRLGWMLRAYLYIRGGQHCFLIVWPCPDCTPLKPKDESSAPSQP